MNDNAAITPETINIADDALFYTPQEVAQLFRVDAKTVVRWEKMGKLEFHNVQVVRTIGGHRRYNKEDINRVFYKLNPIVEVIEDEVEDNA